MKTVTRTLLLAVFMLAIANLTAQKGDDQLKKKIQSYNNQMVKAMIEGNHEKSLSFYAKDVISMPNYAKMMRGLDEVSKHQQEDAAMGNKITAMTLTTKKVKEYGEAFVEVGVYTITIETKMMPDPINDQGKYLTIWEKQSDGKLRISYEIWNTDTNPMMMMKKGQPNPHSEQAPKLEKKQ